jgi:hypothetical protein
VIKVLQSGDDVFDLGGQLGLGLDLTLVIDDTDIDGTK